ncbi:hypothetical protein Hanom_Chr15g01392041 [Helianthus anomalus]
MLDEIISYVQSLQRQVEEMESRLGPSGSLGTDMAMRDLWCWKKFRC